MLGTELHFPWLELSILLPLCGALICTFINQGQASYRVASLLSGLTLCLTLGEWIDFSTLNSFAAHDHWDLVRFVFAQDVFVIDELSAPLLPLTALLYFLAIISTPRSKAVRFPFMLTMVSEAIAIATVSCTKPGLIIALLALSMVPVWIELRERRESTRMYTLHMGMYLGLLLAGWLLVDYGQHNQGIAWASAAMLMMASLLRAGVAPVHPWLTDLFSRASFGTALLFVTPMPGAYAVMRFVMPIAPAWAMQAISVLSLLTAVYAAGMSLVQTDARRFFCYLFLSHSSLVLAGLEITTAVGMAGALCVWLSVGLSLGGFGIILRLIEARMGRIRLDHYHGLYEHMPLLAALFLLLGLSSIGFPGTLGFIGMELLVEGTVEFYPLVGVAVVFAAALNGIAILRVYFLIFTGTRHRATISLQPRLNERFAALLVGLLVLGGGLWPQPGVNSRYHAAVSLLRLRQSTLPNDSPAFHETPGKEHEH